MMRNAHITVGLGILLLVCSLAIADVNTDIDCSVNDDCTIWNTNYYCNQALGKCFLAVPPVDIPDPITNTSTPTATNQTVAVATTTTSTSQDIAALELKVTAVETSITSLQSDIASLTSSSSLTTNELNALKTQVASLQQQLSQITSNLNTDVQDLSTQLTSISTGLAGLQQNLDTAQSNITTIESSLAEREAFVQKVQITLIVIAVLAFLAGGWYLMTKRRKLHPHVLNYITGHIKQGTKFPQIRNNLRKAGWSHGDIQDAYKATMKQNYRRYRKTQQAEIKVGADKHKVISIAIVSVLLIVGILFVVSGTVGQAILFKDTFSTSEPFECTPPHIVTEGGCCLDTNNNNICDVDEEYLAGKATEDAEVCSDHNDCSAGKVCIDTQCGVLAEMYNTGCEESCTFNNMQFQTNDGQNFKIFAPGQGSYTAAGALEWKTLKVPPYCKGDPAVVPVEIIKKTSQTTVDEKGEAEIAIKILSKEIVTLQVGEGTPTETHPTIPGYEFSLTLNDLEETCFQS